MNQKVLTWKIENPDLEPLFAKLYKPGMNPLTLIDFIETQKICTNCQKDGKIMTLSSNSNKPIFFCSIDCIKSS